MRDRLFFPLAAALAAAFIFMALNPFAERLPTGPVSAGGRDVMNLTVSDLELHRFVPGKQSGMKFTYPANGQPALLSITRTAGDAYDDPRLGPHLVLAEDLEYAYQGRNIRVEIEARASGEFPAAEFEADYFARVEGESGWKKFTLTPEFQTYSFDFRIPSRGESLGYDYIGIRPVVPNKQRSMEVKSVHLAAAS